MADNISLYTTMLLIRRFEERLLDEFATGKLVGTTHAYVGQEADAAGIFSVTDPEDVVFSNHRCHGHFLAYGNSTRDGSDPYRLAAELMGKATGLTGGRGGSQHIHWKNFYSNGIQGGIVPVGTGMALAEKSLHTNRIVLVFVGDGTLGEGSFYESLNMASLWKLPVLFVVENNRYAQTTPISLAVSGSISARFAAFDIPVWERETMDVLEVASLAEEACRHVRLGGPAGLILHTYRFAAHSKGDDVRDAQEIARAREQDPLQIHGSRLEEAVRCRTDSEVMARIDAAFKQAEADPLPVME